MKLLSLQEAAEALGYTIKGLRKIVDRSRAKANGVRTRGPTIRFFQTTRGAPIKFKEEWIEEFIEEHTVDPSNGKPSKNGRKKKPKRMESTCGLDRELLNL